MSPPARPGDAGGNPIRTPLERLFLHMGNGITHLHPDDLPRFISEGVALLGGTDVEVLLVDMDQRQLRLFDGTHRDQQETHAVDGPGPGEAYRQERAVVEPTADGVRLWAPIMDSTERLGVLGVTMTVPPDGLDHEVWMAAASLVGESLVSKGVYGDSVARTRRSQDMSLAAEMRWSTLPPLTFTSPRVQITGLLEPAYDIAGDTFDYAVNGDLVELAVLDAMGHGLEASQIANLALGEYRRCRRHHVALADTIRSIDEVVIDQFGDDRYITGQLATLDLGTGALQIINAGHPRPLLFKRDRDAGDVPCHSNRPMGLGLVRTEIGECSLEPGDVALFHTDGVIESRSPAGEEYGRQRLAAVVEARLRAAEPPAEILRHVVHDVQAHSDGRLRDDASLIFLRRV